MSNKKDENVIKSAPYLNKLVDFFSPADDTYRILIKALFSAPLLSGSKMERPSWVINGLPGTGKTSLIKMLALLHGNEQPIDMNTSELRKPYEVFTKRLLTTEARKRCICLSEYVAGNIAVANLARLISAPTISGRPSYGKHEVTRKNDNTYIITVDADLLPDDILTHSFFIKLKQVQRPRIAGWEDKVCQYIIDNREAIHCEIMYALSNVKYELTLSTHFSEFKSVVVHSMCKDLTEFCKVLATIDKGNNPCMIPENFEQQPEPQPEPFTPEAFDHMTKIVQRLLTLYSQGWNQPIVKLAISKKDGFLRFACKDIMRIRQIEDEIGNDFTLTIKARDQTFSVDIQQLPF